MLECKSGGSFRVAFCGDTLQIPCSRECVFWLALAVLSREFPAYLKADLVSASWCSPGAGGIRLHGFRRRWPLPVGSFSDRIGELRK